MQKTTSLPVITLTEYTSTPEAFPFSAQDIALLQERLQEKVTLLPATQPGYYHLRAGSYVGSIPLANWIVVIQPKIPLPNLFYLLSVVSSIPFHSEQSFYQQSDDWFDLLVQLFLQETEHLIRGGIQAGYLLREASLPLIRGKVLFQQMQRSPTLLHPPPCRFTEYTADILENQALKWTLFLLQHRRYRSPDFLPAIRRLLAHFFPVSLIEVEPTTLAEIPFTPLTARYQTALYLARLLLSHLTLLAKPGIAPFSAFLINMPWLFETFVTKRIATVLRQKPITISLQHRSFLDRTKLIPIRIDLLLRNGGKKSLIVDTKYKQWATLGEQTSDLYQMIGYCLAMGGQEAVLIYPADRDLVEQEQEIEVNGLHIHVWTLALEKPIAQLEKEIERLAEKLYRRLV